MVSSTLSTTNSSRASRLEISAKSAAPWPSFRGSHRNDGLASVRAEIDSKFSVKIYQTGNAIFSTPVIGPDERIYVGSADHVFYAFDPRSDEPIWKFQADGVVDSAASVDSEGNVYVPCGDACLYKLSPNGEEQWRLDLLHSIYGTSSTIFWWEGNAVVGPNGLIYAGNDDFCLYAIKADGTIKWTMPTGMNIWSACAFANGLVYFSSFDMHVYAMHQDTGRIAWSTATTNFVSSSPALSSDGALYVGAFDGMFTKMNTMTGDVLWAVRLPGSIYASAAIAPDGSVFIGTAEGSVYALSQETGAIRSVFRAGSPVWSSVSIGCDPEDAAGYLAYVGTSAGSLVALDSECKHRWSYDVPSGGSVNASAALGRHGLAITTGGGEVIYIPYDAYLRSPMLPGFRRAPLQGPPDNADLFVLGRNGIPLLPQETLSLPLGASAWLRWDHRYAGAPANITVDGQGTDFTLRVYENERCIVLIPKTLKPGNESVTVRAQRMDIDGNAVDTSIPFTIQREAVDAHPDIAVGRRFRIEKMRFDIPAIITPFDQIGIASLSIDLGIIRHDPVTGRFVAWGAQVFGVNEAGETVGVPTPRFYSFAFAGHVAHGAVRFDAKQCDFEITAFPIPLDILSFTAIASDGALAGTCCYAELGCKYLLPTVFSRYWRRVLRDSVRWLQSLARSGHVVQRVMSMFRTMWATARLRLGRKWEPWGLLDIEGNLSAVGNFQIVPSPEPEIHLRLEHCAYDSSSRTVHATFADDGKASAYDLAGILLVNTATMMPVVLPYTTILQRKRTHDSRHQVSLNIPSSIDVSAAHEAVILVGTKEVGTIVLG